MRFLARKSRSARTYRMFCPDAELNVIKASGFPAYDQKIQREMRNWKYRPFMINGKAAPVCTAVTFIYQQKG